jgi:geranylgeranyl diphosphate synthase type II
MHLIKDYQEAINKGLNTISYPERPEKLYDPIRYFIKLGGKRIRPVLTLLAAEMYDCPIEKSLNTALAIELFHNFTLMHDDIMDNASLRRGKSTVHEKWNNSIAILSGDATLISAYQLLTNNDPKVLPQLLKVFNDVAIEVCQGQQYDMDYEDRSNISIDDYINMIRLKTAVLLGAALKLGAIVSGAPSASADHLQEFGINVGIAFQLQDDLLDVYGKELEFGKHIGGDIIANKKTFLMLKAIELAKGEDAQQLQKWISKADEPEKKIREVTQLYNKLGIQELTMNKMHFYSKKAHGALDKVDLPESKKGTLKSLTESLLLRNS